MGWGLGEDGRWGRFIGYGVPAYCDYPGCKKEIDRGLAYVCGGEPYGGDDGCGLYFCDEHHSEGHNCRLCVRCAKGKEPFEPKPEHPQWVRHLLKDKSWEEWRKENPQQVKELKRLLALLRAKATSGEESSTTHIK